MEGLSIRLRLALAHTLVFGVLLISLAVALYQTTTLRLHNQVDAEIESHAARLRLQFSVGRSVVTWLEDKLSVERSAPLIAFAIYDLRGNYLDGSTLSSVYNIGFSPAARTALEAQGPVWETAQGRGHRTRILTIVLTGTSGNPYLLRVGAPLDQAEFEVNRLKASIVALVPLVLLVGGIAGWWLAGRALAPVQRITETAGRISALNLAERLPLSGTNDELDHLRSQLNEMIARLQGSFDQMSQFLSNVSHELRTPLAALRGKSEVALRSARTADEFREVLAGSIEMHVRLAKTVADLLALARAEAGQAILEHRSENLTELVRDIVESARPLAEEKKVSLQFEGRETITAEIDPTHTMRMLLNVVDNAIKYNRENGSVRVGLHAKDGWAKISVADTGMGIAPTDLPHVFDRFFRANIEGAGSVGGTGLGLGLARWVAAAHGGRIDVESKLNSGAIFHVWLPLAKAGPVTLVSEPVPGALSIQPTNGVLAMGEASRKRRKRMLQNVIRVTYWLGLLSGAIALIWRGLVAVGLPERFIYGDRAVGYEGFLNGAVLFLLIACATASYMNARKE